MNGTDSQPLTDSSPWRQIGDLIPPATRLAVGALVDRQAEALADAFYRRMLAHPAFGRYLEHAIVNRQLHASMARWLRALFDVAVPDADRDELQRRTGEVHARIGLPHAAISEGGRVLKRELARLIREGRLESPADDPTLAIQYVYEQIDLALSLMEDSTVTSATRLSRADEAFRLHYLTQNLRTERERQKNHLLEWAHQLFMNRLWAPEAGDAQDAPSDGGRAVPLRRHPSAFALWIEHKASVLFEGAPELEHIRRSIAAIEQEVLPKLALARGDAVAARRQVADLDREIDHIKQSLMAMFDHSEHLNVGRDEVTRQLNRHFLPAILKREIGLVQAGGGTFSIALIGLDRFDAIRHAQGQEVTDLMLHQVAEALADGVRAGDFVFRLADAQFLVLLAESDGDGARLVAESFRRALGSLPARSGTTPAPCLTASVGIATFDGHPDYQRLIETADVAMHDALRDGGDRIVVSVAAEARDPR